MSSPAPPMILARGVCKTIGSQEILRGIDLEVRKGETLVILGRSGGGKSVLLKHLVGLMRPDSGTIRIDGELLEGKSERELAPIRRRLGILFQDGALFDSMSVEENVAFPLREKGIRDPAILSGKVRQALKEVELDGHAAKMPVELSGGMRKRASLARVLAGEPQGILYDEPTAGLDPVVADSINHLIRDLQQKFGVTSVVVTHDMVSAAFVADRVAFLRDGRIYFTGTIAELRAAEDPVVRDFVEGRSRGLDWMQGTR